MTSANETRRKCVHAAMTLWILPLRWWPWTWAAALAGAALLVNLFVLPRLGWTARLARLGEGRWSGVVLYPLAVLLAVLLWKLPVAAAAWAVLGIGDAASNAVGRRWGRPGFLGRSDRSAAGTAAFVLTAAPAALAAYAWVARIDFAAAFEDPALRIAALAAAAGGAVAELLTPKGRDDNVAIVLAAGTLLWAATH